MLLHRNRKFTIGELLSCHNCLFTTEPEGYISHFLSPSCHVLFHFKILRFNYVLNKNVPLFWKLGFTRFVLCSYHVLLRISTCWPTFPPRINTFRYVVNTFCYVPLGFGTHLLGFYFVSVFAMFVVEFSKHTGQVPYWPHYVSIRFVTYISVSLA